MPSGGMLKEVKETFIRHKEAIVGNKLRNWVLAGLGMAAMEGAFAQNAPARPTCTALTGTGSCQFRETNGLGPGTRVVLSDATGGHGQSKTYLRDALTRLSQKYGFTLTRISGLNDITDAYLQNAKVIIFSNGDGNLGGSIPDAAVRTRVENFVQTRGWGVMAVHAACAFIDTWPFMQDICVQQYFHHNGENTNATLYVEDSTYAGTGAGSGAHGRKNPYSSFMLAGLPNTVAMTDEWYTWRGNPRTTHQFNRTSNNKIMLLAAEETSYSPVAPTYPRQHYLNWTHTMGPANGIAVYNSIGHVNTYAQAQRAYGDTLLWRQLRYVAKDWCVNGTTPVDQGGCTGPTNAKLFFKTQARKTGDVSAASGSIAVTLSEPGNYRVSVTDIRGRQVFAAKAGGPRTLEARNLDRGLYFVKVASGLSSETRKVSLH